MRSVILLLFALSLASCGPAPVLVTDDLFRASAPEVVRAWGSLAPLRNVRTENLPAGAGAAVLRSRIASFPLPRRVLIGVALTPEERAALVQGFPTDQYVFLVSDKAQPTGATITIDRGESWALVATEAAKNNRGPAAVFYPSDATPQEIQKFTQAWAKAGGTPLEARTPTSPVPWNPLPSQVFQWAGPEADPQIQGLPASVLVHGDPGTVRVPGARGLTWKIRQGDLGNLLWNAVQNPGRNAVFLPLETEWVSR